jgi:phage shock protein A
MQGETNAHDGFHSARSAMTQNADQMAEATIGTFANMATTTASGRDVVAALTQANSRPVKQLEETTSELRELKALLNQERLDKRVTRSST